MPVVERRERDDSGVEPWIADVLDPATWLTAIVQAILTASTHGRCGVCPSNSSQPSTARSCELGLAADDLEGSARLAFVDRQRQTPVALFRDHPVVHMREPVELAVHAERQAPS